MPSTWTCKTIYVRLSVKLYQKRMTAQIIGKTKQSYIYIVLYCLLICQYCIFNAQIFNPSGIFYCSMTQVPNFILLQMTSDLCHGSKCLCPPNGSPEGLRVSEPESDRPGRKGAGKGVVFPPLCPSSLYIYHLPRQQQVSLRLLNSESRATQAGCQGGHEHSITEHSIKGIIRA